MKLVIGFFYLEKIEILAKTTDPNFYLLHKN